MSAYKLKDTLLAGTTETRDLGVIVSDCGRVSKHCLKVAAKARRLTGLMLRTFTSRCRKVILLMLKSIIRSVVASTQLQFGTRVYKKISLKLSMCSVK